MTNDGNLTITDITVTDELTDDEWTLASLAPEASETFTATYTVAEADILAGEVVNVATGKGTSPDPDQPDVPVQPGEDPEPTEEKKGHLTIEKVTTSEPANGEAYALGETIEYTITVTNDGNLTITDITVTDELTDDEWTLASLAPEASETFTATYTVAEADILAGEVVNVATGKGTSPDPDQPDVPVQPGEDPEPTEDPNGHLTINKVTAGEPAHDEGYRMGETIEYTITVLNDGNLTITDITVTDELTGGAWTVASLAPGASETFTTSYVVTLADIQAGEVVNVATGAGSSPDPDQPNVPVTPGVDPEPTDDRFDVTIRVHYPDGTTEDIKLDSVPYGETITLTPPAIDGIVPDPDRPSVTVTVTGDTVVDFYYFYTMTIQYRYSDGTVAAPDHTDLFTAGTNYSVASPIISGYTANYPVVEGTMGGSNRTVTVIYNPNYVPSGDEPAGDEEPTMVPLLTFLISDYETPLGLGSLSLNVGETIE